MSIYLITFYLAIPAFVANMLPVIVQRLRLWPKLEYPLDGRITIWGKRLLGNNKTWRGLIVGICGAVLVALVQFWLAYINVVAIDVLQGAGEFLLFGFLAGFGALLGDALKSTIKRQFNIAAGRPFIPFDQIDYLIGFLVCTAWLISWSWQQVVFLLLCGVILNPLVNFIAYVLKIKRTYW